MNAQSRNRLLSLWLLVSGLFLAGFLLRQSGHDTRLLNWDHTKASIEEPKPNAAIVMLVSPSRITQAVVAIRNIEDRFNRRLKYPYVILTEATITNETRSKVDWITEGRATFADLPSEMWGPPSFLEKDKIDNSLKTIGFSMGYRSMCRFFSGFFWRHPAVAQYEWIWRLDTDVEFHCDIPYDPIVRMREANALYGFIQISNDVTYVQPSLAGNISAFLSTHKHLLPPDTNQVFSWRDPEKAIRGEGGNDDWTRRCFYNNWEISHRSIWTSELYTSLFEHLDRAGGFFYERWGDSPVHALAVSMALRTEQVMHFDDMGYEHQHWAYKCPILDRCTCTPSTEPFDSRGYSWFNASTRP